ncbi:MAG: hypothetical protein ABIE42_04010 [Candidatus Eisenbacteria bacterium]
MTTQEEQDLIDGAYHALLLKAAIDAGVPLDVKIEGDRAAFRRAKEVLRKALKRGIRPNMPECMAPNCKERAILHSLFCVAHHAEAAQIAAAASDGAPR